MPDYIFLNPGESLAAGIQPNRYYMRDVDTLQTIPGGFTAGSILFAGPTGKIAQDNTKLFWDDANNRLGIGTKTPSWALHVVGTDNIIASFNNAATTGAYMGSPGYYAADEIGFFDLASDSPVFVYVPSTGNLYFGPTGGLSINGSGFAGFGGASATAPVHVLGTLRLEGGAAPGSPNDGDTWSDSTQKSLYAYSAGIKQSRVGTIFTQTASKTVTNTVAETSIIGTGVGSVTLPANFFVAGKTIRLRIGGIYSTPIGAPSIVVKIKLGATVIATVTTSSLLSGATALEFDGEVLITCRTTGATGTVMAHGDIEYSTGVSGTIAVNPLNNGGAATTIDTTASKLLDVTVTWDSATTTRIATSTVCTVEVLN